MTDYLSMSDVRAGQRAWLSITLSRSDGKVMTVDHEEAEVVRASFTAAEGGTLASPHRFGACFPDVARSITKVARGWTITDLVELADLAETWHLNDLSPGCAHQIADGWHQRPIDPRQTPQRLRLPLPRPDQPVMEHARVGAPRRVARRAADPPAPDLRLQVRDRLDGPAPPTGRPAPARGDHRQMERQRAMSDQEPCGAHVVTRWIEGLAAEVAWCDRQRGVCPYAGARYEPGTQRQCSAGAEHRPGTERLRPTVEAWLGWPFGADPDG
ncbi:MAG: hypothetical protein ACRDXE_03230 [Acidimicrobiales bacterium]